MIVEPFVALTIQLRPIHAARYTMAMELHSYAYSPPIKRRSEPLVVDLPLAELIAATPDPEAYGRRLSRMLFDHRAARAVLDFARTQAAAAGLILHVGIDLAGCPLEVQELRWETIQDPDDSHIAWALNERLPLARRAEGVPALPAKARPAPPRKALVAVSSPANLAGFVLTPIDAAAEIGRAKQALRPLQVRALAHALGVPCSTARLLEAISEEPDILCLICHGSAGEEELHLWLEDNDGHSAPVTSRELAARLAALAPAVWPQLVIVAACSSGGTDTPGWSASTVGLQLAALGVAAVVATHGPLPLEINAIFLPALLREVLRDGMVDRAMAAARGAVRDFPDWWSPALWLRLHHGRLWAPAATLAASVEKVGPMNEARGFAILKAWLATHAPDELATVATLEQQFTENRRTEQLLGPTDTLRHDRNRIYSSLNQLAVECCGIPFVDLCRGKLPT